MTHSLCSLDALIVFSFSNIAFADIFAFTAPVLESATMLLFGTGLFGFGAALRKRRKATSSKVFSHPVGL